MIKELKHQLSQKYLLLIFVILAYCVLAAVIGGEGENVSKDFAMDIREYRSISEIQERYDNLGSHNNSGANMINTYEDVDTKNGINYYKQLYGFIIDNKLPYDSLTDFQSTTGAMLEKHTQFHAFGYSSYMIMIFVFFVCCLMGTIVPTIDFTKKTAKLVYTTGESKTKILLRKYFVTLSVIVLFELIVETVSFCISLVYVSSGVQYCYILSGKKILFFNYGQFALIMVLNNLLMCIIQYSIVFYFSFLCKSTIISTASVFSVLLAKAMVNIPINNEILSTLDYIMIDGIIGFAGGTGEDYSNNPLLLLIILVYVGLGIVLFIASLYALKKYDFSR